jgi:small subunit ribosomal protein S14
MRRLGLLVRDRLARLIAAHSEVEREAWRLVYKDKQLPLPLRMKAQQHLHSFSRYTRPLSIKNRCIENGRAQVKNLY